jgi:RHH-type transcriptional regulator, proline utilization regulon repressor / proline dehydrogenase / delta 1-pyrroline-5-carboxylate dehydrogenase
MSGSAEDTLIREAVTLAASWYRRAEELITPEEKERQKRIACLLANPKDKVLLAKLIDRSFRSRDPRLVADQVHNLLGRYGVPDFFSSFEKGLMTLFMVAGRHVPHLSVPRVIEKIRQDSRSVIIPRESGALERYLETRKKEGVHVNVNHLGEEVLGEGEASSRLNSYVRDLKNPSVEQISVKISSIFSQIVPLAFEHSVSMIGERLSELYRVAEENHYIRGDGTRVPKFVHLDMESYKDLEITAAAFRQTLDQDAFFNHFAGITLQAYLPDSHLLLQDITAWAKNRVREGGSPIRIRLVKGANMQMELLESSLFDWPPAPYDVKTDTDANYKRMVNYAVDPENMRAVHVGVASHNIFDLAYAYLLAQRKGVKGFLAFEMLEGMADHLRRAIQETGQAIFMYAPVVHEAQFTSAIAYLVRRLDENTGKENFLRHLSGLRMGSSIWRFLEEQFVRAGHHKDRVGDASHRTQNRLNETSSSRKGTYSEPVFRNEPNTDWSLAANREWAEKVRSKWRKGSLETPPRIPIVVDGEEISSHREIQEGLDPSQLPESVVIGRFALAGEGDILRAVKAAKADPEGWRDKELRERHRVLSNVAEELRKARSDLIGAAAANTGKVFTEADVEVSEAVDLAEFYPFSAHAFHDLGNIRMRGKGVGLVISPWNFPIAVPCGGILACLAAGNTVIFKPSSEAILVAWVLCQCFWRAGVSRRVLQFVPCTGETIGSLVRHPDVDFIIFTGGTLTGMTILKQRPDVFLAGETGGKNATIVAALSDRDQAIKNVLVSAFGNGGQKCSATSLLILEKEVYKDQAFKSKLADAAASMAVGSAWDFSNRVGPLIRPPRGELQKAMTELEPGESWALKPRMVNHNPRLWTPGIKWDVRPGTVTHMTEFFGPLLAVMCAEDLNHAIELVNRTGYGLTAGLESLDDRDHARWKEGLRAGNLYINRPTTGAVTLRQPFGGMGRSALGAGIKVGGPDYVAQFMAFEETGFPAWKAVQHPHRLWYLAQQWRKKLDWGEFRQCHEDIRKTIYAVMSYAHRSETVFSPMKDYFHLRGQDNFIRYLPVGTVVVRVHQNDTLFETLARIAAAQIAGCKLRVSLPKGLKNDVTSFLENREGKSMIGKATVFAETDEDLAGGIPEMDRIRYAGPDRVPLAVFRAAAEHGFYIARTPVMMEGRIELLQYYRQQSICHDYHRYGNLGDRGVEEEP